MMQTMVITKQALQAFRILQTLEERCPSLMSATDIAHATSVPRETLYKILAELTDKGWITTTLGRSGGYCFNVRMVKTATVRSLIAVFSTERIKYDRSTESRFFSMFENASEQIENYYLDLPLFEAITSPPRVKELGL